MDASGFHDYLARLVDSLRADDRVLGVVGLGSTAMAGRRPPDGWSDHDIWVVVADGSEEMFRRDPWWLPDHERLVMWMRETPHGMKGLYDDGHLVEAAVFRSDELEVTSATDYEVLLDRGGIARRMEEIRSTTVDAFGVPDPGFLAGQFVTNLLVGGARFGRGERLSGHHFVKAQAVGHLLRLAGGVVSPAERGAVDDLDPWRRVERAFPALAVAVDAALSMPVPEAALALLDAAETHIAPHTADWPAAAATVRRFLLRVVAADSG